MLILQASHSLSNEPTEFLIRDRLSFMQFFGLGLFDTMRDANTIWICGEALTRTTIRDAPVITVLFRAYEAALTRAGFLAMRSQIGRKKPARKPMAKKAARANNARSKVRAVVEHVFADRRARWVSSCARSGSPGRPSICLASIAHNMRRAAWLTLQRQATA